MASSSCFRNLKIGRLSLCCLIVMSVRLPNDSLFCVAFLHSGTASVAMRGCALRRSEANFRCSGAIMGSCHCEERSVLEACSAALSAASCCFISLLSFANAVPAMAARLRDPSGALTILIGDSSRDCFVCPCRKGGSSTTSSTSTSSSRPPISPWPVGLCSSSRSG